MKYVSGALVVASMFAVEPPLVVIVTAGDDEKNPEPVFVIWISVITPDPFVLTVAVALT